LGTIIIIGPGLDSAFVEDHLGLESDELVGLDWGDEDLHQALRSPSPGGMEAGDMIPDGLSTVIHRSLRQPNEVSCIISFIFQEQKIKRHRKMGIHYESINVYLKLQKSNVEECPGCNQCQGLLSGQNQSMRQCHITQKFPNLASAEPGSGDVPMRFLKMASVM
jgi:hypothetical protein